MTKLEERVTRAMEAIADATESISESTKAIRESQKQLNDNFLFHQSESKADNMALCKATDLTTAEIHGIRDDFKAVVYPIIRKQSETISRALKWSVIALIVLAGAASALKYIGLL